MIDLDLAYDEYVMLENDDVEWMTEEKKPLKQLTLTNQKLYCVYKKSNGAFKRSSTEIESFPLSDIAVVDGHSIIEQIGYEGYKCLRIQFRTGQEIFAFQNSPKKTIQEWKDAINNLLGTPEEKPEPKKRGLFHFFSDKTPAKNTAVSAPRKPEQEQPAGPYCMNCGTRIPAGAKFCPSCGTRVGTYEQDQNPQNQKHADGTPSDARTETGTYKTRQQEYVGKVFKCPNCGNIVNISDAICPACGFHLTDKRAIYSAYDFQQELMRVQMTRREHKRSFWDPSGHPMDAVDKETIALIRAYPIPNTIDDLVEFFHLAVANIDVDKSKKSVFNSEGWSGEDRERDISNAWVAKMKSIYTKAEMFFPDEPEFKKMKSTYEEMMQKMKRS